MLKKLTIAISLTGAFISPIYANTVNDNETAKEFVSRIEAEGKVLAKEVEAAYWVRQTYITSDTAVLAAKAGERS